MSPPLTTPSPAADAIAATCRNSSTLDVTSTVRWVRANSSSVQCPSVVSNGSHGSSIRRISSSCTASDFTDRWCAWRKRCSSSGSLAATRAIHARSRSASASRTAARVSSSYRASREAVGRRLSASTTQRTKNAQSGRISSACSDSSMPLTCTR
ncbi:hypothetical protein SALBM217S_05306 [Streptomyces griseoloalbus]